MPVITRFQFDVDKRRVKRLVDGTVTSFSDEVSNEMSSLEATVRVGFLRDVANYPDNDPVSPFVWSSNSTKNDKARKWWFHAIKTGQVETDGKHYIRSGGLAKVWKIFRSENPQKGSAEIVITSTNKGGPFRYKYTVGTFNQRDGHRWQIRGHRLTGWYLINDIAEKWFIYVRKAMSQFAKQVTRRNR